MLGWLVLMVAAAAAAPGDQYAQQASRHRFHVPQHTEELQVGCADGEVHHKHDGPILQVLKRLKRQAEQRRKKRDYIQWFGSTTTYQQSQPNYIQTYQIHSPVPYFVPVWGNPSRIPIFFPAKPVLFNPGYPARNPPGVATTTEAPPATNGDSDVPISIGGRIGEETAGGEPIWGIVEADPPASSAGASRPPSSGGRPTRPPTPPLLHRPSLSEETNQNNQRPSGISNRDTPNFGQGNDQQFRPPVNQFRPQTTTTIRPLAAPQGREEPNRCVWAIISCCNPTNTQISYNCFERSGCPGAFWDSNPCSREVTSAAFNAAAKFYEQR